MIEEWKDIPNYEGLYSISNFGSINRIMPYRKSVPIFPLKADITSGYKRVYLYKNNNCKRFSIHRLVAMVFIGDPPTPKHVVNHIDGNKLNNSIDNLEWVTHKQNCEHAASIGLCAAGERNGMYKHGNATKEKRRVKGIQGQKSYEQIARGCRNGKSKLNDNKIKEIRSRLISGESLRYIAKQFNVSNKTILNIKKNKIWKHVF